MALGEHTSQAQSFSRWVPSGRWIRIWPVLSRHKDVRDRRRETNTQAQRSKPDSPPSVEHATCWRPVAGVGSAAVGVVVGTSPVLQLLGYTMTQIDPRMPPRSAVPQGDRCTTHGFAFNAVRGTTIIAHPCDNLAPKTSHTQKEIREISEMLRTSSGS